MKKILTRLTLVLVVLSSAATKTTAGFREIGGYVDKAEDRFVRNVWNFIKNFQTNQNIGSNTWKYSQYYWDKPYFFSGPSHAYYADAMDFVYASGHGNSYYLQTNKSISEGIDFTTASPLGDLANGGDLEFLVIESCNTVVPYPDDHNYRNVWNTIFKGLHQLVGFRTLSVSDNGIPNNYAGKLKGNQGIWQAWFAAVNEERYWAFNPTLDDGAPYPGFASAVVYSSTENDRLGNYVAADPSGTAGMHSWWQY